MPVKDLNEDPENGRIPFSLKPLILCNLDLSPHLIKVQLFEDRGKLSLPDALKI